MRAESDPGSPCSTACACSFGTEPSRSAASSESSSSTSRRRSSADMVSRISMRVVGETRVTTVAAMAGSSSVKTCRRESARGSAFNSSARSAGCSAATAVAIACAPDSSTSATSGSIPSTVEGPSGVCALMIDPQGCEWSGTVARFGSDRVAGPKTSSCVLPAWAGRLRLSQNLWNASPAFRLGPGLQTPGQGCTYKFFVRSVLAITTITVDLLAFSPTRPLHSQEPAPAAAQQPPPQNAPAEQRMINASADPLLAPSASGPSDRRAWAGASTTSPWPRAIPASSTSATRSAASSSR